MNAPDPKKHKQLNMRELWHRLNAVDPAVPSATCNNVREVAEQFNKLVAMGLGECEVESFDEEGTHTDGVVIRKLNDENTVTIRGSVR